jgi:hypothetical protein
VRYLLPAPVVDYIEENGLYQEEGADAARKMKEGGKREQANGSSWKDGCSMS